MSKVSKTWDHYREYLWSICKLASEKRSIPLTVTPPSGPVNLPHLLLLFSHQPHWTQWSSNKKGSSGVRISPLSVSLPRNLSLQVYSWLTSALLTGLHLTVTSWRRQPDHHIHGYLHPYLLHPFLSPCSICCLALIAIWLCFYLFIFSLNCHNHHNISSVVLWVLSDLSCSF